MIQLHVYSRLAKLSVREFRQLEKKKQRENNEST